MKHDNEVYNLIYVLRDDRQKLQLYLNTSHLELKFCF